MITVVQTYKIICDSLPKQPTIVVSPHKHQTPTDSQPSKPHESERFTKTMKLQMLFIQNTIIPGSSPKNITSYRHTSKTIKPSIQRPQIASELAANLPKYIYQSSKPTKLDFPYLQSLQAISDCLPVLKNHAYLSYLYIFGVLLNAVRVVLEGSF